ncbi:prenyltransferase [Amphritea balenae]|uniref:Prenyltransferase n=1 Tax=Amphritea balenae TaxID=452629 RepID=A0A3P1SMH8_9GAMM|nr:prenyltransferase [Amphritea balenae]RRC98230.1 prenyltransferase [Amphritea balenae]GGK80282.1 1,4-dihydroxy-2-naphthoate octaprenyltransferase [Amphritea balenae]
MMTDQETKYRLLRALRPFSFSVALITCLVGVVSAFQLPQFNWLIAAFILLAAVVLQAGVNLINDYSDLSLIGDSRLRLMIERNFRIGLICFLLAAMVGIYLVTYAGTGLLILLLIGLAGALGYTLEPVNFKRRGLAVVLVFWLMGVLMVCGSYYIIAGSLEWSVFWRSVPVSLISSLLLLANEIRDIDTDTAAGIRTLSVRIGRQRAQLLYRTLLLAVILLSGLFWWLQLVSSGWWLVSLPLILLLWQRVSQNSELSKLPPDTGRFFMLFGLSYCLSL